MTFLVTTDSGGVTKINPNGAIIPFASGLIDPHGLAFRPKRYSHDVDGVGNLLVADTGAGQIYEYTTDGNRTPFGTAGGSPNFLAFERIFPAKADFNGDGKSDILWQNNANGVRVIVFMDGTSSLGVAILPIVPTEWNIVGSDDFNGDLNSDILWQNSVTGQRVVWLMNGASLEQRCRPGNGPDFMEHRGLGRFQCGWQAGHSLGKQLYWPARHLVHERHEPYWGCGPGNVADIVEDRGLRRF